MRYVLFFNLFVVANCNKNLIKHTYLEDSFCKRVSMCFVVMSHVVILYKHVNSTHVVVRVFFSPFIVSLSLMSLVVFLLLHVDPHMKTDITPPPIKSSLVVLLFLHVDPHLKADIAPPPHPVDIHSSCLSFCMLTLT